MNDDTTLDLWKIIIISRDAFTYVVYNAIKHELVTDIADWSWTSFHQIMKLRDRPEIPHMHHLEGANIVEYVDINEEE